MYGHLYVRSYLFNSLKINAVPFIQSTKGRLRGNMETKKFFVYLFTVSAFLMHAHSVDLEREPCIGLLGAENTFCSLSGVDTDRVSVMEGDSVTICTGVKMNRQEKIKWYFNKTRIAHITGDLSYICTDVQCNAGNISNKVTERFRGRLKLDHHTGSLTIMNIRNRHSGEYTLMIINGSDTETIFNVSVHGVSAAERDKMKRKSVKEGESVTLDPGVITNPHDLMKWYFKDIHIAEITGDQSQICTDVQCEERFRDRLKVNETGSLTIMNIRDTDSGLYHLKISNGRFSIIRCFGVSDTAWIRLQLATGEL